MRSKRMPQSRSRERTSAGHCSSTADSVPALWIGRGMECASRQSGGPAALLGVDRSGRARRKHVPEPRQLPSCNESSRLSSGST